MTEPDDEETERRRRQREDTKGAFARLRRWTSRPYNNPRIAFRAAGKQKTQGKPTTKRAPILEIPAEAYDHAAAFLGETLDSLAYGEADYYDLADDLDTPAMLPAIDDSFQPPQSFLCLQL